MTDHELLTDFAAGNDRALASLVAKYVDMVHAAARRQAPEHADDVTQAVFILLSRKAATLVGKPTLAGWLLTATRLCAARARRTDQRRKHYEWEAGMRLQAKPQDSANAAHALLP